VIKIKIGAIIQARTGSTRLPNKILKPIPYNSDITALQQVIRRVKQSQIIKKIIIATTDKTQDDVIIDIAKKEKVEYFRGSENDVLARYYYAAKENSLDTIVRITSDCPCIDGDLMDRIIEAYCNNDADYVTNTIERTYPRGLDVEVVSFSALEKAHYEAKKDYERDGVCDYIYEHPQEFKLISIKRDDDKDYSNIRITLDTEEDYMMISAVYDYMYDKNNFFSGEDIINLINNKPWLTFFNKEIRHKLVDLSYEEELKEASTLLEVQKLNRAQDIINKHIRESGY